MLLRSCLLGGQVVDLPDSWLSAFNMMFGRKPGQKWEPAEEELAEFLFRNLLRSKRREMRRGPYGGSLGSKQRRIADQFARQKSRKQLKRFRAAAKVGRPRNLRKELLLARFRPSPILDRLLPDRHARWRPIPKRLVRAVPAAHRLINFSFLTHPTETMEAVKAIGRLECNELNALLHFDDSVCLDAGSYLVLAEVWHSVQHTLAGGRMPQPIQYVLGATGVGEHNRMRLTAVDPDDSDDPDKTDVWALPLRRRRPARSSTSATVHLDPQTREKTADDFCDEINRWLAVPAIDRELTKSGRGWIAAIIGELLCNAERHSQPGSDDGDWSTTAFMARRVESGVPTFRCYIAFLSVGQSIYEGLVDAAAEIRAAIDRYTEKHRYSGISKETLETVFALQDTVTRDPAARAVRSGGTGLQDVLDVVNLLGGTAAEGKEPRVTLISGKACIQLRPPYIQGVRAGGSQDPRLIWFNPANKAHDPPDQNFVRDLPDHFAGTLVSVAFTLDPAYFATHMESADENDQP